MNTLHAHLGPYADCEVAEVESTESRPWCLTCDRSPSVIPSAFCSRCGSRIQQHPFTVTNQAVDAWSVREGIREVLYHVTNADESGHVFWLPNRFIKGRRDFSCGNDDRVVEVTTELIKKEVSHFADDYQNAIRSLEQAYDPANVRVC